MNKRNFAEDLTAVLVGYDVDPEKIKFPIKTNTKQRETTIKVLDLGKRSANILEKGNIKTMEDLISRFETIKEIKSAGEKTTKEIRSKFLQWWYETLEEKEVRWFWKEFIKINQVAYVL